MGKMTTEMMLEWLTSRDLGVIFCHGRKGTTNIGMCSKLDITRFSYEVLECMSSVEIVQTLRKLYTKFTKAYPHLFVKCRCGRVIVRVQEADSYDDKFVTVYRCSKCNKAYTKKELLKEVPTLP